MGRKEYWKSYPFVCFTIFQIAIILVKSDILPGKLASYLRKYTNFGCESINACLKSVYSDIRR